MRVIFLDIDGVLHPLDLRIQNSRTASLVRSQYGVLEYLPLLVEAIKPHTDVRIVISSSWRFHFTERDFLEILMPDLAGWWGGFLDPDVIDREEGIDRWLSEHQPIDWRAVDDQEEFFQRYRGTPNLITTIPRFGLQRNSLAYRELTHWLSDSRSPLEACAKQPRERGARR